MTTQDLAASPATAMLVNKTVHVAAPPERAFDVFTKQIGAWWPLATHHIGKAEAKEAVIEPRVGGRWFERGVDGSECDWGRVIAWEPPARLVLGWQLSADWKFDADLVTEVEVRFVADGGGTRVELEHRLLERYGARADEVRTGVGGPGGWTGILARFAQSF
jgi:uncharacterized protein YndB with AHSA1/START domain